MTDPGPRPESRFQDFRTGLERTKDPVPITWDDGRRRIAKPMLSTDRLEIHLIGGLGIRQGGRAIDLPTHKSEGLLAVLALRPGTDLGRERLSDLPWSRSAPAQARASLRQALNQLRRALESLGPELIEARGDSLRLRRGCVTVEVAELEQALD